MLLASVVLLMNIQCAFARVGDPQERSSMLLYIAVLVPSLLASHLLYAAG